MICIKKEILDSWYKTVESTKLMSGNLNEPLVIADMYQLKHQTLNSL